MTKCLQCTDITRGKLKGVSKRRVWKLTENIMENYSMGARIKELKNLDNLQKMVFRNYYGNWMKLSVQIKTSIYKTFPSRNSRDKIQYTRVVPKVMSNHFLHANWEQQTKQSMVVDGTSCCAILECLVMSIACITWPVSLLTKWPTTICRFASVLSSKFSLKRKSLLQKFIRDFSVLMEVCAWV